MKVALINASPRGKVSTSALLLKTIKPYTPTGYSENTAKSEANIDFVEIQANKEKLAAEQIQKLKQADTWVFANPLYIDSLPGHLLSVLEQLQEECRESHRVHAVINCGFYEAAHNKTALRIYENWCKRCGYKWCGGAGIGGGGAIGFMASVPFDKGPLKAIGKALEKIAHSLQMQSEMENAFATMGFPRFIYILCAHHGWKKAAKENGLKTKDLYRK